MMFTSNESEAVSQFIPLAPVETVLIGGIKTVRATRSEMAERMAAQTVLARRGRVAFPHLVFSSNGSVIATYHSDPRFRELIDQADLIDADGMPLVMASRLLCHKPLRERVATTDFIEDACEMAERKGVRFYFLGAAPGVAARAAEKLRLRYPRLQVVGTHHGYFDDWDVAGICKEVVRLKTDVLWVGIGSPQQECFAVANRSRLAGLAWIRTCGGLFDHMASMVPRAPHWMQESGLEWLYRATKEPRRLGLRYVATNPLAAYHLMTKTRDLPVPCPGTPGLDQSHVASPEHAADRLPDAVVSSRHELARHNRFTATDTTSAQREDLSLKLPPETASGIALTEPAATHSVAQTGWRSDIDGLRALAVLPVVIFHVAQSLLRGGYVGVDIFFVISGYLISRNVFQTLARGTFSLGSFYEHRLRRIFPAYSIVLLASLGLSIAYDLPTESRGFGVALLSSLGSLSNIYFWATTDYFLTLTESQPLLHTWSLSVEEQFYLLFPVLALCLYRRESLGFRRVFIGIFLMSFAVSIPAAYLLPLSAFYSLVTRAWEFLIGGFLALGMVPPPRCPLTRNLTTGTGLVLILASMALLTPLSPFPGLAALPPCLGAALIILGGEKGGSIVSQILSWRPVAFIGFISYSLYLWHWPVIVAHRAGLIFADTNSKLVARGGVFALSLALAALSWWAVERTTRDRRRVPTKLLLTGSAVMALVLAIMGVILVGTEGLPGRFSPQSVRVAAYLAYNPATAYRQGRCFLGRTDRFADFDQASCLPEIPGRPTYLLLGDSHAAHLYPGVRASFPDANILQVTGVLCPATTVLQPVVSRACPRLIDMAANQLPGRRQITKVWLSSAWSGSLAGGSPGWSSRWLQNLEQTVEMFHSKGIEAVIIGPNPEYAGNLPRLLALGIELNNVGYAEWAQREDVFQIDRTLARFAAEKGFAYVSLIRALCGDGHCPTYAAPGIPLLFDVSHFTEEGSIYAVSRIADAIR